MSRRRITKDEINRIAEKCPPRERAFFTIMRQSGLPPHRLKQLKIADVEEILDPNTPTPCKICALHETPNFIAEEAVRTLKQYLNTRTRKEKLAPQSLLFTARNNPDKEINTKSVSRAFKLAVKRAKIGKPNELKLYSLIEFYKTQTKDYREELKKLGKSNTPKDDESYRKLYEERAMSFLKIELPNTQQLTDTIATMQKQINQITQYMNKILTFPRDKNGLIRLAVQPIADEDAIDELASTPEENQIDLTPNQQNIRLRRKLAKKLPKGK